MSIRVDEPVEPLSSKIYSALSRAEQSVVLPPLFLSIYKNHLLSVNMLNFKQILENEETLDPQNWAEMRQIGHQMIDDMMDYLQNIAQKPVWQPIPNAVKQTLKQPLPQQAEPLNDIYNSFKTNILPYPKGNIHPRFWSWVQGTGTPFAMLAEMLAAGMNSNVAIGEHSAMYVEQQVIEWCKQLLHYPNSASGLLLSGASMANITALIVARNAHEGTNVRKEGLPIASKMVLYASAETHSCIQRAAEVIGIGSNGVRKVNVDEQYKLDITHLKQLITADKAAGLTPFCVVGNAGTVNTGAIDPLTDIAKVCKTENLWFHVDGAFGALAKLVPEYQTELQAIEQADSLAFDLHKWLYMPYEVACVLIKNAQHHRNAFALQPSYLLSHERGLAAGPDPFGNYGMELSRGFKALKVWMSLKEHGSEKFARLIRQNIAQAFYLADLITHQPYLELVAPVTLNIVCFRFNPPNIQLSPDELNELNKEILMCLHEQGLSAPSSTILNNKYVIRMANVNHRSRKSDFEALVQDTLSLGLALLNKKQA